MKRLLASVILITMFGIIFCASGSAGSVPDDGFGILFEQDDSMKNIYSLIAVRSDAPFKDADGSAVSGVEINVGGADAMINWFLSAEGRRAASEYGEDKYGEPLFFLLENAPESTAEIPQATDETRVIRISTTTSVNDSGLLGYLLPIFEREYGYRAEVHSAGTGKAIADAKLGNADLLLVHSEQQEEEFVKAGFARVVNGFKTERLSWLYNYFVLCGPGSDPAGVRQCRTVKDAFAAIAKGGHHFISRGDGSGTHTKEVSLWPAELGITTEADSVKKYSDWYTYSNAGMGVCLNMARETGGYILSDKATFLAFRSRSVDD